MREAMRQGETRARRLVGRSAAVALVVLAAARTLLAGGPGEARPPGAATQPAAAPVPLAEGDLAALREAIGAGKGSPTLVNFWATWCAPCVQEIPILNGLQERLGAKGLRTLAVSLDPFVYTDLAEARAKVTRLAATKDLRLPVFLYTGGQDSLLQSYDLPAGLPHTLLLDGEGKVAERVEGQLEPAEVERLEKKARELLEGDGASTRP